MILTIAKAAGKEVEEAAMHHHRDVVQDLAKSRVAKVLLDFLVARFEGKTQSAIEKLTAEYSAFTVVPPEKVEAAVDRLDSIIQRLASLGQPPSEASKVE
jgi:hypothetical protein